MRLFFIWAWLPYAVDAVWPLPQNISTGTSPLWIHIETKITVEKPEAWQKISGSSPGLPPDLEIINNAISKTRDVIFRQNFIPWRFNSRNSAYEPQVISKTIIPQLRIHRVENRTNTKNVKSIEESYSLRISVNGDAELSASTGIGILRGLTTFSQLFYSHSRGGAYTTLAPITITDSPRFEHRGLNLDVARNYYPVRSIEHLIDTMAFNKFNKLHLHITDSQAWPLEIPSLPDLARKGAYHPSLVYTPNDISSLQRYGALRGVEVFLEIDMPGHTSSIYHAYPNLISAFNIQPGWTTYAAEPPSGTLKLNSSAVNGFLETVLNDVLPRVKPFTSYFHTGGDEVNREAYSKDNTLNTTDVFVFKDLMDSFVNRNHKQLRAAGVTPIVWQEMLLEWDLKLGKDVIVQAWQGGSSVSMITRSGYKAIAGTSDSWYLDCGQGSWLNPISERAGSPYTGCFPKQNWRMMYTYDPLQEVAEAEHHLVIGGEAHIWSEQIDHINMDTSVWPRASAVAEVLWSGPKDVSGKYRSVRYAAGRLSEFRERMVAMGVMAEPIQMPYCLMEKDQCDG